MAIQLNRLACGLAACCSALALVSQSGFAQDGASYAPGGRVLLDAHNCYPYNGKWTDRLARALATGTPVAIEQDLVWIVDAKTGDGRSAVSHGKPFTGSEPTLEEYFFEPVAPLLRDALARGDGGDWPLIVLNIDFKDSSAEHCQAVWNTLKKYEALTTTAVRTKSISEVAPLEVKPLLILTSGAGSQYAVFYENVPQSGKLLLFGAVETIDTPPPGLSGEERVNYVATIPVETLAPHSADNFRRWWNNPWRVVEAGGQLRAGEWTEIDTARLEALVKHAHATGLWIRFYTLNGHDDGESLGWDRGYNFGSLDAVEQRWRAAIAAGVDFVATDMYESFDGVSRAMRSGP